MNKTINEEIISFETSKLLKEKKIDLSNISNLYYYDTTGEFLMSRKLAIGIGLNNCFAAPTQNVLQKILRDKFKIHIIIEYGFFSFNIYYNYNFSITDINIKQFPENFEKVHGFHVYRDGFTSFEKCLEQGLQDSLKLIKTE